MTAAAVEIDYPSKDACAKCGRRWIGEAGAFAQLLGLGDGVAHIIHHDCPDPSGRVWWAEPAPLRPTSEAVRRRPRYRTRPQDDALAAEIDVALKVIRDVALRNRQFTAAAWRIRCDQAGVSEQARSDAVRRAVTVHHYLELVDLYGGRMELADIDRRTPQYRSLIYVEPRGPRGVDPKAGRPRP